MPLYKYVSAPIAEKIIDGKIRFTQPNLLNDPFELLPEILVEPQNSQASHQLSFDLTAPRRNSILDLSVLSDTGNKSDLIARQIREQLNSTIGILCLSKNPDSLSMWAHYAQDYTGVLIEFDETHDFFQARCEVEYVSSRPVLPLSHFMRREPIPIAELQFKSNQWEVEQEVRVFHLQKNCFKETGSGADVYLAELPLAAIKSLTLGERMPVQQQQFFYARLMETRVGLKLAAVANNEFGFRYDPIKWDLPYSEMGPVMSPRTAHIFRDFPEDLGEAARWMVEKHRLSKVVNQKA
ncbi:MAG: DUF2971 domain-containing protein [bacterium]|nr:DUF2971 domain-containing protein [bacterium]